MGTTRFHDRTVRIWLIPVDLPSYLPGTQDAQSFSMRLIALLFAGVLGTGCYATGSGYVAGPTVAVSATTVAPDLVYVSPGVQVIADFNEPVFYSDGFYWRETGGTWYRSSYHTHGWGYAAPPRAVLSIGNRHSYRHYRPSGYRPRANSYRPDRGYSPRASNPGYQPRPAAQDRRNWDRRDRPAKRDTKRSDKRNR